MLSALLLCNTIIDIYAQPKLICSVYYDTLLGKWMINYYYYYAINNILLFHIL